MWIWQMDRYCRAWAQIGQKKKAKMNQVNESKWLSREASQHEHDQELPDERGGVRGE